MTMKKSTVIMLAALMVLSLAACVCRGCYGMGRRAWDQISVMRSELHICLSKITVHGNRKDVGFATEYID